MGKAEQGKHRYIAFKVYAQQSTLSNIIHSIRKQLEQLYGIHGSGMMFVKPIMLTGDIFVLCVGHDIVKKVIAATSLMANPRIVPIVVSGTIASLERRLKNKHIGTSRSCL